MQALILSFICPLAIACVGFPLAEIGLRLIGAEGRSGTIGRTLLAYHADLGYHDVPIDDVRFHFQSGWGFNDTDDRHDCFNSLKHCPRSLADIWHLEVPRVWALRDPRMRA